jgi:hypothetical protein
LLDQYEKENKKTKTILSTIEAGSRLNQDIISDAERRPTTP